ncbi:hypothetical protein [Streptomyces sp. NPDC002057]|uniref:WXG100-like domain-containing protein n=1 Tax=Streptomyces sp. NPDC002057 TaxID=3154664 RepID=UPI0033178B45
MAINPPEGVADFLGFVSGMEWPEADEDLMRRVSEHYGSIARDLETLTGYVVELIPIVKNDFDGEAADSFLVAMRDLTGQTAGANQLEQTAELSRQLSEVALKVANQVEYTKIMAILQLVQLLAEILFATLFSVFTFGAVWGPVSAMFAATREGIHQLFRWLLQTILSQTFIGIMGGVFQDTVIQLYQLGAGHTTSWNTESLIDSVKQGALTGLVGGPLEVFFHYGGKMLGRLLGGRTPGSILSKRIDDVLNKADDTLGDVPKNKTPDVPTGGAGPKSKLDDIAAKTDKELPPTPVNRPTDGPTPPPVPPKTPTEGVTPPPAGRPKTEAPGGAGAKDQPNPPATGAKDSPATGAGSGTGAKDVPVTGRTDAPATGKKDAPATGRSDAPATGRKDAPGSDKADAPATGRKDADAPDKADAPASGKTETVGGKDAPGAGKSTATDAPAAGTPSKSSDASTAGRAAGDTENPLDDLLATKEARSDFAKDIGELLGGVNRQLETGFLRFGEGTIADTFAEKMGKVFADHLKHEGAEQAGKEFGEVLARKWVRLGADHGDLPELLTKAMGDLGNLAPLKNLADAMPDLFNRSQHSNALARVFKQENPLQGSPMYQLGGAVASLLSEGTHEMLSEGFYNLIFGDGEFTVTGGPFASGVAMGALSHGLHRMFEPVMVKYQNWVLSHQHAENPHDNKYFGLLHPINIASFVANMTGNPAPWPVPRPTDETQNTSFTRDMKDMVKWVFSNPFTGTPFFSDTPGRPDIGVESDGDGAFVPLDLDLGTSFADDIAKDPLFLDASDGDALTGGGRDGDEEASDTGPGPSRPTVSSDLSSLLGLDPETSAPGGTDQEPPAARPVTQSAGDRFAAAVPNDVESSAESRAETRTLPRTETAGEGTAGESTAHPLQAEKDKAAAEGLGYLLVDDDDAPSDHGDDTPSPLVDGDDTTPPPTDRDGTTPPLTEGDGGRTRDEDGDDSGLTRATDDGDDDAPPPGGPVRDIPAGLSVGVLTPAQTTALQALPRRPGVFVVGMHTDPRTPHDPALVLKALIDAQDSGRLDGVTEIQFTACNLAAPVHEATVRTVMSGLWKHRAQGDADPGPLTARAADAPVWYVPTTGGDTADAHLITAQHIGLTPDGKIAVVDEGAWHAYDDGGAPDHTPVRTTPTAAELPDDAVRFLFRTPAVDTAHPEAVAFGAGGLPSGPSAGQSARERAAALMSDPDWSDTLAEVLDGRDSPGGDWTTMSAETYLRLRERVPEEDRGDLTDDDITDAFEAYASESATDAARRLSALTTLVKSLHFDAPDQPLTPDVEVLVQRLLLDQGLPPARLTGLARTSAFWKDGNSGQLNAELILGMADIAGAGAVPLTERPVVAPSPTPSDDTLAALLPEGDADTTELLRDLLDGAHHSESPWHTLGTDTYLSLRARVQGSTTETPDAEVRRKIDDVFATYATAVGSAAGRTQQLQAVADAVLTLHAVTGLPETAPGALTAHSRFLVPRMLQDLGIAPVPLPGKLHEASSWQTPKMARMRATRVQNFAAQVASAVMDAHPEWSRPSAPGTPDDGPGDITPTRGTATVNDVPEPLAPAASATLPAAPATDAPAPQHGPTPDGTPEDGPAPRDFEAELNGLGTRTQEVTTGYLSLTEPPVGLVGRADRLLRTDGKPYTTLTRRLPEGTEHWLEVTIPAGHAVATEDGRLLVGKAHTARLVLSGPDGAVAAIGRLEQNLRTPGSATGTEALTLPLTVLSRVGQALYANPLRDEHHTTVRTAVRMAYADASRDAERSLGEYLTGLPDVQRQVRDLVGTIWARLSDAERAGLGTPERSGSGSVGNDLATLREVVEHGNIREQMHLLVTAVHGPVRDALGLGSKPTPRILTRERSGEDVEPEKRIQQQADVVQLIEREKKRLRDEHPAGPDLDALLLAQDRRRRTELLADEVVPPLSARERAHALDQDGLTWEPGERHRQIALLTESQVTAEGTGGLMSAGTSNTTYFALEVVDAMARKWKVPVDFRLVRLALMADMLPVGHHTFHEIMTASEAFERDVLARRPGHVDVLGYTDDWSRFRSLQPLTEGQLRAAMPDGRFPDEVALGLEAHETTPDLLTLAPAAPRTVRALPEDDMRVLVDRTPGLTDRTTALLRETLGDGGGTARDWRRTHADNYLELRARAERPDDPEQDAQTGVWDELPTVMERLYRQDPDAPERDLVREGLDAAFDAYYTALDGASGDRARLTALVELVKGVRAVDGLPPSDDQGITADVRIVAQRLLVDQGFPPALWGAEAYTAAYWQRDTPTLVNELMTAVSDFTAERPVRRIPAGVTVGRLSAPQARALDSLPSRPGVFVVGMHTDPDTPPDPDAVLRALTDAHDDGRLDGVTEIRFTACGLASPVHENTVRTVMGGLWRHRAGTETGNGPLTALAADAPVWSLPGGALFTARNVGVTADGKVTVFGDGADWHRYSDDGAPDHTATSTPVGDDGAPADAVRAGSDVAAPHEDAVRFGDGDDGEDSASISMTVDGLSVLRERTIAFPKGEKTLTDEGRTALQDLAMELFPELVRRSEEPSGGELRIHVSAGGNNLLPGAAREAGEERALTVAGALATEIRNLAYGLDVPKANAMAVFAPVSRGRDTTGLDTARDTPTAELRRRATVSARVQDAHTSHAKPMRSMMTNAAAVDLFRRLADSRAGDRTPLSLDELVGSRIYWKATPSVPEDHNLVFHVETAEGDGSTRHHLTEDLVVFAPGTRVRVVGFERMDSGRSLVTLREVDPGEADERDGDRPPGRPGAYQPVIGIPGVSYEGPNRPFDSALIHDKGEEQGQTPNKGKNRKKEGEDASKGHYKFRKPLYIHRGEVEVEMTEEGPHVRFYTVVTNRTDLTIDRESGRVTSGRFKDIQQDPVTGRVVLATGPTMEGTLWTGIGTPARAIAWAMKYKAETPPSPEPGQAPQRNRPLIRSYLVPLHIYRRITSLAVPEGDAHQLGAPYRGSDSLDPRKVREPVDTSLVPEALRAVEETHRKRWEAQAGSTPDPIEGPTPLSDRTVNTDQPGERNQFGIRGEHLALLRESIVPGSLVTYFEAATDLSPQPPDQEHPANGRTAHVDVLRGRLGIPAVDAPQLQSSYNPWVQNEKHVNSPEKLKSISTMLRQHYVTWQYSRQEPAHRMPNLLLDHDTTVLPYHVRVKHLEKFLADHEDILSDAARRVRTEGLLGTPDSDDMPDAEREAKEAVEDFMRETVLTWASHAEIGYLLALQHKEVKADRNVTDAPVPHDFDEMRRRRREEVHLQTQVGADLTRLVKEGGSPYQVVNRLIRDHPELRPLYAEICAPSEGYTFFQHAQMVLGQYLKLAHRDTDDARRLVPVDAVAKAILFHDIEKANSKAMYGDEKDPDQEQEAPRKGPRRKERHDYESEHRGAVEVMSRYRHLWGDVDVDRQHADTYWAAVRMVDSDPFGFYYRGKHADDPAENRDATFHWIVKMYLDLKGRSPVVSDGTTRGVAVLDTGDTEDIRRLFHEFHQYYQADFSSYSVYSTYDDDADPTARRAEILRGENASGVATWPATERKQGKETFTRQFLTDEGQVPPDPENPYGTGPRVTEASPVGDRSPLRFVFSAKYEAMYDELAAMFDSHQSVVEEFQRVGGARMRADAQAFGDMANATVAAPAPAPVDDADGASSDQDGEEGMLGGLWGDDDLASSGGDGASTGSRSPGGRVDELVESLTRSHRDNGTHHLVDPDTAPDQADRHRDAVGRFPRDERFFSLAGHITGTDGAPTWRGQRVSAGELATVLSRLADDGVWDTAKPLQFAACGLGEGLERSYAADTLRALRELRPELPLTVYAPRSTLWFVPPVTGPFATDPSGPGHLAVAQRVAWDADGMPRLVPDHWVRLSLAVHEGAEVEAEVLGAHLPPDGELPSGGAPSTAPLPDGYLVARQDDTGDFPEAVAFGTADTGEGSSSRQPVTPPVPTVSESAAPPPRRAPWYVGHGALGDGRVTAVLDSARTAEDLKVAGAELRGAGIDARTAAKVMGRLAPVLSSADPASWNDFLRSGLVFRADGRVVVVTARPDGLVHHAARSREEAAPYASRNQAVTNRAVSSGGNASVAGGVDVVMKLADVANLSGAAPSVKLQAGTTYGATRTATSDTQGAGRTVVKETHAFDGGVRVQVRVLDQDPRHAHTVEIGLSGRLRLAFPEGVDSSGDDDTWQVVDPGALKSVLSTVNAVAPGRLLADLASTLDKAGFAPDVTAAFVSEVSREFFNEKAFKDGNQWWSTGSLASRVFTAGGFPRKSLAGHFLVGAELTGLQRKGETGGPLRVREDFSDAFGVKSSGKFGDRSGLTVGAALPVSVSEYVIVPSLELALNAARSHQFDVGGSDKSKAKLKHAEETQAEYRATARFHVEFVSSSKRPPLSFDSTLEMAVGVPASRAADFEARLLGPVRRPLPEAEAHPADTAPRPASRFRAVGLAVSALLRLARQEPSAHRDVGAERPFPSGGMPDPAGLLKIAGRHPIEIATPDGTLPGGAPWTRLRNHPRVSVVAEGRPYSPVNGTTDGPAFRYHVNAAGQVTTAQRLGTSTFDRLFGALERGAAGLARLSALGDAHPGLGFTVHGGSDAPPRLIGSVRPDGARLVVHQDADGTLDVRGTLRHPVEQVVRNLAAGDDDTAARPTRVYADVASELEDFAAVRGPVEVRIDPGYAAAPELTALLGGNPDLFLGHDGGDPRRPAAYLMEVTRSGALLGPFRQRDFGSDPVEPPALASRTGLGPGVVGELPGSQQVLKAAREWLGTHLERTGLKRRLGEEEYAQFHRELTASFGTPGMRARFAKLLGSGVPVVLKAGDQEIRLHLRTELRDLRGTFGESGLSLTRSATRTTNQAVGVGDQVSFSAAGGATLRVGTGEKSRVEVPAVKVGGGATLSHVKDSVTATVKASREQETSGEHTAFTYAAVHHLTATVHDSKGELVSGSSLRIEGDDVSAVVRVGNDHLPGPATVPRASTGTVTVFPGDDAPGWIADDAVPEFILPRNGLGGVHPEFLGTGGLTSSAGELIAEHGGGTPPRARDDEFGRHSGDTVGALRHGLTPEIEDALTPNFLQSRFEQLTGPDGAVFPLPPGPAGRAQALVVRLRLGRPVHEGTGTGTSLAYGAEAGTKSATAATGSYNLGAGLGLGGYAALDGASVAAGGSVDLGRTHTDVRTVASASTATSTLTYKGTSHRYRADAYYEISHHTWRPDGRFTTSPSDHSLRGRLVKVDGGVELTVPDHQARALGMDVPGERPPVAAPPPRSYVDADLAKAVSHVEKLDADDVLPEVRRLLGTLKGLPGGIGAGTPTDLSRGLASVFSAESLRAHFTALSTTSVRQLIKLRQHGGGTRLVGVRVTAALGDPAYVGPREQVTLAVADTATRSTASASGVSDKVGGQFAVTVKGTDMAGLPRGGVKAGVGAETSVGRTRTDTSSERDQHSLEVTGTAQEFRHSVTYTVEVFDASEPHQTVRMAGAALNAPAQWVDRATGGLAGRWFAERWGGPWEKLFPSGHRPAATNTLTGGEARLLVPDHLTRPGAPVPAGAVPVSGRVRPNGPTAVSQPVEELNRDLASAVQALSLPGLDRVLRWLPAAASLPRRVAEGDTAAPTRQDLAPATLAGLRTDLLTTEQNLRANVRRLLDGGYTVPVADGEEITVRMVVHRARHLASGEFETNVETLVRERETERERERTTIGWSGSVTPDGRAHATDTGTPEGPGVSHVATNLGVPLGVGGERGHSLSSTRSETVDERDRRKGTQHYYTADVTWVLTGSRRTTVEVTVDGGLIGVLHDDTVDGLVRKHPGLFGEKPEPRAETETETGPKAEAEAETGPKAEAETEPQTEPEPEPERKGTGTTEGEQEQDQDQARDHEQDHDQESRIHPQGIPLPTLTVTPPADAPAPPDTGPGRPAPGRLAPPATPRGPVPTITVTPPPGSGEATVPDGGPAPRDPGRLAPPAVPPGPVPVVTVTPPSDPAAPAAPSYRLAAYETAGTASHTRRVGEARVEMSVEGDDPIALALNGPSANTDGFPAYRPVRPFETVERPVLEVSADHRFAVPDHEGGGRAFYAAADAVEDARTGLTPAGIRLDVDPDSSVRFARDGVEHTLVRVTVGGGGAPGSAPLVLAGDPEGRHVVLRHDARPGHRDADMRRAVEANLGHYGPELERIAVELERADPEHPGPRTVLARALADLHRVRREGGAPGALARAESEAARAFAAVAGDGYGTPEDDWRVVLAPASAAVTLPAVDWSF